MDCLNQPKRVEYEIVISENLSDVIGLTEIFPKHCIYELGNSIYHIDGYDMSCSPLGEGRGVVIYVRNKFNANSVTFETSFKESVWCKIQLNKNNRSPNRAPENSESLQSLLRKVRTEKYTHLLVMGEINWEENSSTVGENHNPTMFLE